MRDRVAARARAALWAVIGWIRADRGYIRELQRGLTGAERRLEQVRSERNGLQVVAAELRGQLAEEEIYRRTAEQRLPSSTRLQAIADHERLVAAANDAVDIGGAPTEDEARALWEASAIATRLFTEEIDRAR